MQWRCSSILTGVHSINSSRILFTISEMYPASEGFFAFQTEPIVRHMRMVMNNGIFFEFIPFNGRISTTTANRDPKQKAVTIDKAENGKTTPLF